MTDQELQQLAQQYAEDMCPIEDYTKGDYIDLEARNTELQIHRDDAMQVLRWITKTHCIVSREKARALHNNIHGEIMYAHDDDDWQEAAHYILDVMPRRFVAVFGTDVFEESSEK